MASDSIAPVASIVVPTRARPAYLEVALASLEPQVSASGGELIVVDDAGASEAVRSLCERFGARYEPHARPRGLNVARNTGVERSRGELVVFVDDDVEVREGWLAGLLDATLEHPEVEVFTGPIHVRLEGAPPHTCGREAPPITSLELGERDGWTPFAWGSNMAIRRSALERVEPFDVSLEHGGDEQELQERLGSPGAMYVAAAALDHRRMPADARLRPLCRAAYVRGRAAWRFDAWRGRAPSLTHELRTLASCLGHVLRRRCPMGLTMVAHSCGRVRESAASRTGEKDARFTPPFVFIGRTPPFAPLFAHIRSASARLRSNHPAPLVNVLPMPTTSSPARAARSAVSVSCAAPRSTSARTRCGWQAHAGWDLGAPRGIHHPRSACSRCAWSARKTQCSPTR